MIEAPGQWIRHVAGMYDPHNVMFQAARLATINAVLRGLGFEDPATWRTLAREISALHMVQLDVVGVAARLESAAATRSQAGHLHLDTDASSGTLVYLTSCESEVGPCTRGPGPGAAG